MNATFLGLVDFTCSTMSTTGPHTRLWHRSGVAKVMTTGRLPRTSARSVSSRSLAAGRLVSMREASPLTDASVGVWTLIAWSPARGGPPLVPTSRL